MEAYARPPADPASVSSSMWDWQRVQYARSIDEFDLMCEIGNAGEHVLAAIKTGDAALIGRVVLAVHGAFLDRMTDEEFNTGARRVSAEDAALSVLLAASVERAKVMRGEG